MPAPLVEAIRMFGPDSCCACGAAPQQPTKFPNGVELKLIAVRRSPDQCKRTVRCSGWTHQLCGACWSANYASSPDPVARDLAQHVTGQERDVKAPSSESVVSGWCEPDEFGVYLFVVSGDGVGCCEWSYLATSVEEAVALWRADERRPVEACDDQPGYVIRYDLAASAAAQKRLAQVLAPSALEPSSGSSPVI